MSRLPIKRVRLDKARQLEGHISDALPKFSMEELYNPTMITLNVPASNDSPAKTFIVPLELLCAHSTWFKAALKGGFQESGKSSLDIKEVDPAVFECFLKWIYRSEVSSVKGALSPLTLKSYFLADYYNVRAWRQRLLEIIQLAMQMWRSRRTPDSFPAPDMVALIYNNTPKDGPLRKTVVEACLYAYLRDRNDGDDAPAGGPILEQTDLTLFPVEFVADCTHRFMRFLRAHNCVHCGGPHQRTLECRWHEDGKTYGFVEGKACPIHCLHHEPEDARVGMNQKWCRYHDHETQEERRLCAWRYESLEWRLYSGSLDDQSKDDVSDDDADVMVQE